jgi:hypothetical protein
MASKAKSGKGKNKAKKPAKKPAKGKSSKKAAGKPATKADKKAKTAARNAAPKKPSGKKQKHKIVKTAKAASKSISKSTGKKQSMTEAKPAPAKPAKVKKEKVAVGIAPSVPAPGKSRPTGVAEEPQDVDEYETQRQAAVEPFKRSGAAPKPGAAGRLFDDEAELEDYDPLFDEVEEEDE